MSINLSGRALKRLRLPVVNYYSSAYQVVSAQAGDVNTRYLDVVLYDDRGDIDLGAYSKVYLQVQAYDGISPQMSEGWIDTERNRAVCRLTSSMLQYTGSKMPCNIWLVGTDADDEPMSLTSQTFYVMVYEGHGGADAEPSEDELTALQSAINDVVELEKTVGEAEANRQENFRSVYIKYSFDANGYNYTDSWQQGQQYMGVANTSKEPEDAAGYSWILISGGSSGGSAVTVVGKNGYGFYRLDGEYTVDTANVATKDIQRRADREVQAGDMLITPEGLIFVLDEYDAGNDIQKVLYYTDISGGGASEEAIAAAESASQAASSAEAAESSASAAQTAKEGAETAKNEAAQQATNAGNAAQHASTAAENAGKAQTAAESAKATATQQAAEATNAAQTATSKATEAAEANAAAQTAKSEAQTAATNAGKSATAASESAANAEASKEAAATSESNAAKSATAAAGSATTASNAATAAQAAQGKAETAQAATEAAKATATQQAAEATNAAQTATSKATEAAEANAAAQTAKSEAQTAATNAGKSATAASESAANAEASKEAAAWSATAASKAEKAAQTAQGMAETAADRAEAAAEQAGSAGGDLMYISPDGDDANDGLTADTPKATVKACFVAGASRISAKRGVYRENVDLSPTGGVGDVTGRTIEIFPTDNDQKYSVDTHDRRRIVFDTSDEIAVSTFTAYNSIKSAPYTMSNYTFTRIFANGATDERASVWLVSADELTVCHKLIPVTTLAEVESTANTFYWADGTLYVNSDWAGVEKVFVSNEMYNQLQFKGLASVILREVEARLSQGYCVNIENVPHFELYECVAKFTGVNSTGLHPKNASGKMVKCYATRCYDGLSPSGYGHTVYVDCVAEYNRDDGLSHHNACTGTIIGGRYSFNGKCGIDPAYGAKVDIYNVLCEGNGYDYNGGGIGYLYAADLIPASGIVQGAVLVGNKVGLSVGKSCTVVASNCVFADNDTDKSIHASANYTEYNITDGLVKSVNGVKPDSNGNVTIEVSGDAPVVDTNLLHSAINSDGSKYGDTNGDNTDGYGNGYRVGYRVSSGGVEKESSTNCCTGFIACQPNKVFTMENFTNENTGYSVIYFFDSSFAKVNGQVAVKDCIADGVATITVLSTSTIAYMRITTGVITDDTVITKVSA